MVSTLVLQNTIAVVWASGYDDDMSDPLNNDDLRQGLYELNQRLQRLKPANENRPIHQPFPSRALHAACYLLGGILTGFVLGYTLDWWLTSKPWCTLIGLAMGTIAGVVNMLRDWGIRRKK